MKKRIFTGLLACLLLLSLCTSAVFADRINPYDHTVIESYEEYLAIWEAKEIEHPPLGTVQLPGNYAADQISCLGVFEYCKLLLATGSSYSPFGRYDFSFLTPGYRVSFSFTPDLTFEDRINSYTQILSAEEVSKDDLQTVTFSKKDAYLKIGELYFEIIDHELESVNWFLEDGWYYICFEKTTDTSPLFDKLTEEQLGEMEAFREGLLSKTNCVSTMEAVDYLPGLLGTGMKIKEDDSSVPTGIYEETSAEPSAETTSAPAVSEPKEPITGFWFFVGAGIGILAVTITAIILLLRKKK